MTGGAETLAVAERPRAMAHPRLRVAIVGVGSMGSNHARVVAESAAAQLALIVDSDMARARAVAHRYGCPAAAHLDGLSACDAVIVSTSTEEHTRIGLEVIAAGKPLLVEKPVSERLGEVEELLQAAATADIPLMCGFVERFNPVISTMLTAIDEPVRHFVAIRHSPPNPTTTGVVHDLLIHDLDLAIRLNGGDEPDDVSG
ncbi:MAG TPA: Gfo/Idh/MocA family oxidoreductase, partial [Candidatus Sulfotelmatobacter sp.]|nr:Gfo/Idh/MocA family oxidoreductase [Candidatus Sulfotelmatobacter sp.]